MYSRAYVQIELCLVAYAAGDKGLALVVLALAAIHGDRILLVGGFGFHLLHDGLEGSEETLAAGGVRGARLVDNDVLNVVFAVALFCLFVVYDKRLVSASRTK